MPGRRHRGLRALAVGALAGVLAVLPAPPTAAVPDAGAPGAGAPGPGAPGAGAPAAAGARPSADASLPTPTAPHRGLPPQGSAPDGGTVGGDALASRGTVVADGAPPLPGGVLAAAWLVADAGTGEVLAARDAHGRYYPASTLKLLTLLALAPALDPAQVVVGTAEDAAVEGSRVGVVEGGRYPVALLLRGLVMQSGNDAAHALARAYGGTPAALRAMNSAAEDLGAHDTVAGSTSGLDVAGQSSSPYDLALVLRAVLADERLAGLLTERTARMPAVGGRYPAFQIQNENPLLGSPGNLGGKTGFTDAARHTYVTAAERHGRRVVVSVMRSPARPLRAAQQAELLLDWGFSVPAGTRGVGRLVDPGEVAADMAARAARAQAEEARARAEEARAQAAGRAARSAAPSPAPAAAGTVPAPGGNGPAWLLPGLAAGVLLVTGALGAALSRRRRPLRTTREGAGTAGRGPGAGTTSTPS